MCILSEIILLNIFYFRFEPGPSSYPVWLQNIHCWYNNDSASGYSCVHDGLGVTNCIHSQDVGISCLASKHYYYHDKLWEKGQTHFCHFMPFLKASGTSVGVAIRMLCEATYFHAHKV